jgi:hypothetical protein
MKAAVAGDRPITFLSKVTPAAEKYVNAKFSDISSAMTKRQLLVMSKGNRGHLNPVNGVLTSAIAGGPLGAVQPPTRTSPIPVPTTPTTRPTPPPSTRPLPPGTITPTTVITPETKFPPTMLPSSIPPINDPNFLKPSVNYFLKWNPDFALSYKGLQVPVKPTTDELEKQGGLSALIKRGGYLLYKPVMDGIMPIAATEPPQETDNYLWGVFVSLTKAGTFPFANQIAKILGGKTQIPEFAPGTALYSIKMRRLNRSIGRALSDWTGDAFGYLKSAVKWACGGVTNSKLQTASDYAAAYGAATGPGAVYIGAAAVAWKTAAAACGMAFPKPTGGAPAGCNLTPPAPLYPPGSIATFNKKQGVWLIAVPPGTLAGDALYVERGAEAVIPNGVTPVSIWTFQNATRPWYRRWSTYIMGGISVAAIGAGAGTVYFGEHSHRRLPG